MAVELGSLVPGPFFFTNGISGQADVHAMGAAGLALVVYVGSDFVADAGEIRRYHRADVNSQWALQSGTITTGITDATDVSALELSGDGLTMAVGQSQHLTNQGQITIYRWTGSAWVQDTGGAFVGGAGANVGSPESFSLSDNGAAIIYAEESVARINHARLSTGTWSAATAIVHAAQNFSKVVLSGDGLVALTDEAGVIHSWDWTTVWTARPVISLTSSHASRPSSIETNYDGSAVGVANGGHAGFNSNWLYTWGGAAWSEQATPDAANINISIAGVLYDDIALNYVFFTIEGNAPDSILRVYTNDEVAFVKVAELNIGNWFGAATKVTASNHYGIVLTGLYIYDGGVLAGSMVVDFDPIAQTLSTQDEFTVLDLINPTITATAEAYSATTATAVDGALPIPALTATAAMTIFASATLTLPLPKLTASVSRGAELIGSLPIPVLEGEMHLQILATLDGRLVIPALTSTAQAIKAVLTEDEYQAWCMNMRNFGVSEYENFAYTSLCRFQGKLYGTLPTGVFEIDGDTDDGTDIDAEVMSGIQEYKGHQRDPEDFSLRIKQSQGAYMNMRLSGEFAVTLLVDEQEERIFTVDGTNDPEGIHRVRVKIPPGIQGLNWQFGFKNINGSNFHLKNYSNMPVVRKRRV
jgi:hypothetical protein